MAKWLARNRRNRAKWREFRGRPKRRKGHVNWEFCNEQHVRRAVNFYDTSKTTFAGIDRSKVTWSLKLRMPRNPQECPTTGCPFHRVLKNFKSRTTVWKSRTVQVLHPTRFPRILGFVRRSPERSKRPLFPLQTVFHRSCASGRTPISIYRLGTGTSYPFSDQDSTSIRAISHQWPIDMPSFFDDHDRDSLTCPGGRMIE